MPSPQQPTASSSARQFRINANRNRVAILQAIGKEDLGRYQELRKRVASRQIQVWFRKRQQRQQQSTLNHNNNITAITGISPSASNSLFVSALPSTVNGDTNNDNNNNNDDDELSESSNSALLDLTLATTTGGGDGDSNYTNAASTTRRNNNNNATTNADTDSNAAKKIAYAAAVDASRLADLQQAVIARSLRRAAGVGFNATNEPLLPPRVNNTTAANDPSAPTPQKRDAALRATMATLAKLRDRSDAILHKHLQRSTFQNNPEIIHARRVKLAGKIQTTIERLSHPARPEDVLIRASSSQMRSSNSGSTAEYANGGGSSSGGEDTDGDQMGSFAKKKNHHTVSIPNNTMNNTITTNSKQELLILGENTHHDNISKHLPPHYANALRAVRFPSTMSAQKKQAVYAAHTATCDALGARRHWWQVHREDTSEHVDIRAVSSMPAWPWEEEQEEGEGERLKGRNPGGDTADDKENAMLSGRDKAKQKTITSDPLLRTPTSPHQPGFRALNAQVYLPPRVKSAVPVYKASAEDAASLAMEIMGNGTSTTSSSSSSPAAASPNTHHAPVYAYETGPNARPSGTVSVSDKDASEWWLAFVCAPSPLYSQIGTPTPNRDTRAPSGGSPSGGGSSSSKSAYAQVPNASTPLSALDLTLPTAARVLGVIDPWSTAAAYMDAGAVTAAARAAMASTAKYTVGVSGGVGGDDADADDAASSTENGKYGLSGGGGIPESVEDLLNMSAELAAAPALDFYAPSGGLFMNGHTATMSPEEAALRRLVGRGGGGVDNTQNNNKSSNHASSSSSLATPALAAPAEPIGARVKITYDAVKRRLAMESTTDDDVGGGGGGSRSVATLTRQVAARKIQRQWRGVGLRRIAMRELARRRERAHTTAATRGAAMTAALSQFMAVLEESTGVELGASVMMSSFAAAMAQGSSGQGSKKKNGSSAGGGVGGGGGGIGGGETRDLASLLASGSSMRQASASGNYSQLGYGRPPVVASASLQHHQQQHYHRPGTAPSATTTTMAPATATTAMIRPSSSSSSLNNPTSFVSSRAPGGGPSSSSSSSAYLRYSSTSDTTPANGTTGHHHPPAHRRTSSSKYEGVGTGASTANTADENVILPFVLVDNQSGK